MARQLRTRLELSSVPVSCSSTHPPALGAAILGEGECSFPPTIKLPTQYRLLSRGCPLASPGPTCQDLLPLPSSLSCTHSGPLSPHRGSALSKEETSAASGSQGLAQDQPIFYHCVCVRVHLLLLLERG